MKYAIDLIEAPQDLIQAAANTDILRQIAKSLFKFPASLGCWLKMDEDGDFYLSVDMYVSGWDYLEWNPELLSLRCGWDLEAHLQDDEDYYEDQDTGQWGIEGWKDPFEYLWFTGELVDDLEKVLIEAFYKAKLNRIIDEL